jgi:NAD(P)H dehydrogenase (quinone)
LSLAAGFILNLNTVETPFFFLFLFSCRLTAITQLTHHGMIFVPIGYTAGACMFNMTEPKGGSPYGAGTFAGDGSRTPSKLELEQAFHQGKYMAGITKKLKTG